MRQSENYSNILTVNIQNGVSLNDYVESGLFTEKWKVSNNILVITTNAYF